MLYGEPTATCEQCAGVWLAAGGLDKIARTSLEQQLREEWTAEPDSCRYCRSALGFGDTCPTCGKLPTIACPSGHGVMNTAWVQLAGTEVEVDQCHTCGGLWIDAHERELLHASTGPRPVSLDEVVKPPPKSLFLRPPPRPYSGAPQREIDKFLQAANSMSGVHGFKPPSLNTARVMAVVAVVLFIVFNYFFWPYITMMLM